MEARRLVSHQPLQGRSPVWNYRNVPGRAISRIQDAQAFHATENLAWGGSAEIGGQRPALPEGHRRAAWGKKEIACR